jgi:hypothetical integral membrane protein (TIGR02206 family)
MNDWFGSNIVEPFNVFGTYHLVIIFIYIIGLLFLVIYSTKLRNKSLINTIFRWGLFSSLILSELSYQTWGIMNGSWNPAEFLPFQLCSIAGIIAILTLYTRNKKLIQIIFFIGIIPSFLAIITPELHHGYPHFRFWQFFLHHVLLSWASIYLVIANPFALTLKKTLESYLYLLCYAGIIGFIMNPLANANFLFLARAPSANTPLNLLGNGLWYYVNLCLVGLLVFLLQFGFTRLFSRIWHKVK